MNASKFFLASALSLTACAGSGSPATPALQTPQQFASVERSLGAPAASCLTAACVYVTNQPNNRHDPGSYALAFDAHANGNLAPVQTIRGSKTGLGQPEGIAVDAGGNIYVTNNGLSPSVTVFAPGANGNVAPLRSIVGPRTGLKFPTGIALDAAGNIYVADFGNGSSGPGSVEVYAAGSNGNAAPLRTIQGDRGALSFPIGIALDSNGNLYVVSGGHQFGRVTVYAPGAHGDAKPLREIIGSRVQMDNPVGIALDANGVTYVANGLGNQLNVYAAGANGNVAPIRVIAGPHTKLRLPLGIALDGAGNIYVSDSPQWCCPRSFVRVYAAGANGDVAPLRSIGGSNTEVESLGGAGIAVH